MDDKVVICSVGDLMICDSPLYASVGVGAHYHNLRKKLYSNCKQLFTNSDLVIGNFETVVHTPKRDSLDEIQMSCEEIAIADLKDNGFSVLNIANNHCLQHEPGGFQQTISLCDKNDIKPIGIMGEEPYIATIKGTNIAFLSLCIHLEWYQPDNILYENNIERVLKTIKTLRSRSSDYVIIVSVHWGDEYAEYPSNAQIALAHKFVDLGANIILGHHPHVFQGVERYNNALIAYSQGNFISDMVSKKCRETGVVRITFSGINDIDYEIIPFFISDEYIPIKSNGEWLQDREIVMNRAVGGEYSDDDYWNSIKQNHLTAHRDFVLFFKSNLLKYKVRASTRMIYEFIQRKIKRMIGTSTDGRVSSMDSNIYDAIGIVDR